MQGDHYTAPYYSGRMLSAMALYYRLTGDERWRNVGQRVVNGLIRQAVDKGDDAYFPQHLYGVNEVPAPEAPLPGLWGGQGAQAWIGLGLAQFYQVTGYEPALLLLGKLARCIRYQSGLFDADGRWEGQHFHFTLHHLLALLGYAQAAHDAEMISFANAGYQCARAKATMNPMVGYVSETDDPDRFSETCGVADMIDLALKLTKAGAGDYWDDVDRWTRNQFAGNQLLSSGWVYEMAQEQPRPALDPSLKDLLATNSASPTVNTDQVPERCLGAFASYPSANQWIGPLGFNVNAHSACCTGNGARAIYYVWNNIVHSEDGQLRVNLLLNRASPWADVDSFIPYEGRGDVKIKQACELSVRIPEWVQPNETRCQVNGTDRLLSWDGRYAVVGQVEPNDVATLSFPIFERTDQVQIKGRGYTLIRKGNTVVHIDPPGEYGPLYQREKYRENKAPSKKVERFVALQQIEW